MIITKNNKKQELETVGTSTIEAVCSRVEILELIETKQLDKENLVLISISEPVLDYYKDEALTDDYVKDFKDSLRVKFWDVEEDFGKYKVIPDYVAKEIQDFIRKNLDNRFIIHCRAGQSRSAGVAMALECIKFFGIGEEAKYNYKTCFDSEIKKHSRYSPNLTVFDKIVKDYRLFKKSEYETEFENSDNVNYIFNYKGYDIYSYYNLIGEIKYTFWTSSESSEYYSGLSDIDECKLLIDNLIKN